jgi:hypothetical protein
MKPQELREEVSIELEALEATVYELGALHHDVAGREPTTREKTAAAAFLAQFYNGIENILKRISHFHGIPLPRGETWHVDLFQRFTAPPYGGLPVLFDEGLAEDLAPYRRFRHVVLHSYSFQLDWHRMAEGVAGVQDVFSRFRTRLAAYLAGLTG